MATYMYTGLVDPVLFDWFVEQGYSIGGPRPNLARKGLIVGPRSSVKN